MKQVRDRYAGDAAWRQWFDICCLTKCDDEYRSALVDEVASALGRAIDSKRCTLSYDRDYLVAYFDEHFKMGGSFDRPKPLKQYFLAKIPSAKDGLRGVVLGSILSGEVMTMSRNIKSDEDGTQTRWYTYPNNYKDRELRGKKVLLIGKSFDEEISDNEDGGKSTFHDVDILPIADPTCKWTLVQPPEIDVEIDNGWFTKCAREFLKLLKRENKSEKIVSSAAMVYARANKISPTRQILQRILGVKQGGAAKKMHQMEDSLRRFCKRYDIRAEGLEFMRVLLSTSITILKDAGLLEKLEAAR